MQLRNQFYSTENGFEKKPKNSFWNMQEENYITIFHIPQTNV